jgi:replication-associated recombination protein RarA
MNCEIKYAPKKLDDLIYPNIGVERRIKGYASKQLEGHIILYGPNGTGKSSLAQLLVQEIGNHHPEFERKDADELLTKTNLKKYLLEASVYASMTVSEKFFLILNEFDYSKKNLDKFWTALDACGNNLMVLITTNQPMNVHTSIRARCDLIEMEGICAAAALQRIQYCLNMEGLNLPDDQVLHYLKTEEHFLNMRRYLRLADYIIFLAKNNLPLPTWTNNPKPLRIV